MMLMLLALTSQAASEDRVGRLVDGDLDETTLAFFGGGKKSESKPKKAAPKKEENSDGAPQWLQNLLNQGGVTQVGYSRPAGRGKRDLSGRAEALPPQGFVQPPVVGVRPPSMFRQSLMRAPLVGMIGFFIGSGVTYALFRPRNENLDFQALLSA